MLATQTCNFLFIIKLQLQLQFYLKTHKETNREKSDYTLADDELAFQFSSAQFISGFVYLRLGYKTTLPAIHQRRTTERTNCSIKVGIDSDSNYIATN